MSIVPCLTWVKQGKAKSVPDKVKIAFDFKKKRQIIMEEVCTCSSVTLIRKEKKIHIDYCFPVNNRQWLGLQICTPSYNHRFRDSSAQNHFGPGLLGPDVSAHFSIRDCSAHFSGTARPIFFIFLFILFIFFGGVCNLLFYSVCVHQNNIQ